MHIRFVYFFYDFYSARDVDEEILLRSSKTPLISNFSFFLDRHKIRKSPHKKRKSVSTPFSIWIIQ
jgi:hypothetical protein